MNILACLGDPLGCVWGAIPVWAQWGLGICAVFFISGVIWRFRDVLVWTKGIAGWPGVGAVIGAVAILFAVFWPRARKAPDAKAKPAKSPKPSKPRGKRRYNLDTNEWEDL